MANAVDDYQKIFKERIETWNLGMRDEVRGTLLKKGESQVLFDVSLDQAGTLYPVAGHEPRYASAAGARIDGLGYYEKADGKRYLMVAIGTSLFYDDLSIVPAVLTLIDATRTASTTWDFTTFRDEVYIVNGKDKTATWSGVTFEVLEWLVPAVNQAVVCYPLGTATLAGTVSVIVTAVGMTGTPYTLPVTVALDDNNLAIAAKIGAAISSDATLMAFFTVEVALTAVTLTTVTPINNDPTMDMTFTAGTATGVGTTHSSIATGGLAAQSYILSHVEVHNNMLWGSEEGTSTVRWSNALDGRTWGGLSFMEFNPSDGDNIRRIIKFQSYIVVMKRKTKAIITGDRTANYAYTWLDGHGSVGTNAVDVAEKYVAYVANDGIRLTNLTTDTLISQSLNVRWQRVNKLALKTSALIHWRNYILVALPMDASTVNSEVWLFDMRTNAWVILRKLSISAFALVYNDKEEEVIVGSDSVTQQIYQLLKYNKTTYADGTPVEYEWLSREMTADLPERYKLYKNIYIEMEGVTAISTITMSIFLDDVEYPVTVEDISVPAGAGSYRTVRLIPPIYGAVLGRKLSIKLKGQVGVRSVIAEYSMRSNVAPGGVL